MCRQVPVGQDLGCIACPTLTYSFGFQVHHQSSAVRRTMVLYTTAQQSAAVVIINSSSTALWCTFDYLPGRYKRYQIDRTYFAYLTDVTHAQDTHTRYTRT